MGPRAAIRAVVARLARAGGAPPLGVALLVFAAAGLGLGLVRPSAPPAPAQEAPAQPAPTPPGGAVGSIPILGDPVRDLTVWYAERVGDANRAALTNMRGRLLTPLDPLASGPVMRLYGTMVAITIPILTLGGLVLGFLIMTGQADGGSAYEVRSTTPRFVVGAVVALLGVFLVSALAQFTSALDAAMVGVSLPAGAVGGPDAWPAGGGVFAVLANGGFDPQVAQGPNNWNDGAWLSVGLLAAILSTLLAMGGWVLAGAELLLVLVGPLCLAAHALAATERVTRLWLRALAAAYLVRFAWTISFALFSLMALPHVGASGAPPTLADTNLLLGLATGALALMLATPVVLVPLALGGLGAAAERSVAVGRLVIARYAA
ncbi:MAG: hypothetical protein ACYDAN_12180 [Candidatus Limnocylindrales bacterium]